MQEFAAAGLDSSADFDEGCNASRHRCRCCGKRVSWDKNHAATLRIYMPAWQKPLVIGKCGLGIQEFSRRTASCVSFEAQSRKSAMRRNGYAAIRIYAASIDKTRRVAELVHQLVDNVEANREQERNPLYRRSYRREFDPMLLRQREAHAWRLSRYGTFTQESFSSALERYPSARPTRAETAAAHRVHPVTHVLPFGCTATDFLETVRAVVCSGATAAEDMLSYY